jgi:choline dehydrogenase-like flavoprotein
MDFDVIVIGYGFGGSVSALRLSKQGYRVGVLEQGRRFSREDFQNAKESMCDLIWMPGLGLKGCFTPRFFRHVNVVGGLAVIPAPIIGAILWQRGYQWSFIVAGLISLIGLGLFTFFSRGKGLSAHTEPQAS